MSSHLLKTDNCLTLPGKQVIESAFLIAHALREGKELHIHRDGAATIERIPVAEFFASPQSTKPHVTPGSPPSAGSGNVFRLEYGSWNLAFGGIKVYREPNSVGLQYCHKLLERQFNYVSASRLVGMVADEPVEIMKKQDLLEGDVATYEAQNPKGGDESITEVVTSEYIDEILSEEDRGQSRRRPGYLRRH